MAYLTDKQIQVIAKNTIDKYHGNLPLVESAIGALYAGRVFGWKPMFLIHDKKTLKKYEVILGINFREAYPEVGPRAEDSRAFQLAMGVSNFWKAVKGEIPGIRTPEIR